MMQVNFNVDKLPSAQIHVMIAPSSTGKSDAKNTITDSMCLAATVLQAMADDSARILGMQYGHENLLLLFPGNPTTFVRFLFSLSSLAFGP